MTRVGVFGGTFDPCHFGHLHAAQVCLEQRLIDQVWFVPAVDPWQKQNQQITSYATRVRMLQSLIASKSSLRVSEVEKDLGKSETFATLSTLGAQWPRYEFVPIIGADLLDGLHTWRDYEKLISKYRFLVVSRPGQERMLPVDVSGIVVTSVGVDISSSDIRTRTRHGESISQLVPHDVAQLIEKELLYRN